MRKNWLFLILATILVTIHSDSNAQTKNKEKYRNKHNDPIGGLNNSKKLRVADDLFLQNSYFNAIDYYQQLKQADERNPYITYQLAECYRATRDYVPAAHYYNEVKAMAKKIYPLCAYYAGLMLKQQGEYLQAIESFNEFLDDNKKTSAKIEEEPDELIKQNGDRNVNAKWLKELKKRAAREVDGCNLAIKSIKEPGAYSVINCGPNVNTTYTELSPMPLGDSALVFGTIGRINTGLLSDNGKVIETGSHRGTDYKEKLMIAHKQPGYVDSFQWPLPFYDGGFNDPGFHTANGCYAPGGKRFYFSKCREDASDSNKMKCDIYCSKFGREGWQGAIKVPIGDEGTNTMPNVAKVGKKEVLFFSSSRKLQSRGGYDIWYSIIDPRDGSYRRPQNCGKVVNTKQDELTPFYDTKSNTLYFSSNGQVTMGGFDIFSAVGGPSRFSNLHNVGYPVNTSADEFYYVTDPVGTKSDAYLVSNRIGSYALKNPTCCNDIWRVQREPKLVVMGKVISKKTQDLLPQTVVKMIDQKGDMNTYNSEDGNFLFNMSRTHSYVITGDKPGYTSTRASVSTMDIKRSDPSDTVHVTIYMDSVRNSFSVSNIYYDYDKATLRAESVASLDSVVHFLTDNPSITVEIYSYTDSKGTEQYNKALSQRRAQSVLDYLEKNSIERGRLTAIGFGDHNPAAPNAANGKDNPEGRQLNRRTEFRIITDLPTRRVLYNSALPGSMDQQERNLSVEPESDDEPVKGGKRPATTPDDNDD